MTQQTLQTRYPELGAPALAGVVTVLAGTRLMEEILQRVLTASAFSSPSRILVVTGAAALAVGLLAVVLVRVWGAARGGSARVALGTGVAIGAASIATGVMDVVLAVRFAVDETVMLGRHDLLLSLVLALLLLAGLSVAGVGLRPAVAVALALAAVYYGVYELDLSWFTDDVDVIVGLHRFRFYLLLVGVPALAALAVLRLAPASSTSDRGLSHTRAA